MSSLLGVVPKSEPGKFRVIHDLSFPKHDSVNLLITEENFKVKYDSIDVVADLLRQFGQGALMAKTYKMHSALFQYILMIIIFWVSLGTTNFIV